MEPITTAIGLAAGGTLAATRIIDYLPNEIRPINYGQEEREERLRELQERHRNEDKAFQLQRDANQQRFQLELEANRLAFQERQELRRLQFQKAMQEHSEQFQRSLVEMQIDNSQEIAKFQAIAMRETQILVARENAQNMLQDHMVQNALKDFPLNISPLVLLKNRPHSLSSLLRFTVGDQSNTINNNVQECAKGSVGFNGFLLKEMIKDVQEYAKNPEALNIFVAPIYVDSKIKNRKVLSEQIWDTTYQKLESFFTRHYNRRSERPVIFYPTAWNDKFNPGMHASETLHFFLRDMPCIVIEPRFDGENFRLMISTWNLGYTSTEHIRTEINFNNVNIDAIIAHSAYERSQKSANLIKTLLNVDMVEAEKRMFYQKAYVLDKNIKIYEALKLDERMQNGDMDEIDAIGIYNLFQIDPVQDLSMLSDFLSAEIGMTLATLSDIHHLISTDAYPIFPSLMVQDKDFNQLYQDKKLREKLFLSYNKVLVRMYNNEAKLLVNCEERELLKYIREERIEKIQKELDVMKLTGDVGNKIRRYCKEAFGFESDDFEAVWETCIEEMRVKDLPFFKGVLMEMDDNKKFRKLDKQIQNLERK